MLAPSHGHLKTCRLLLLLRLLCSFTTALPQQQKQTHQETSQLELHHEHPRLPSQLQLEQQQQQQQQQQVQHQQHQQLLRSGSPTAARDEGKVHLRVCNAFPFPTAMDIKKGSEMLTKEEPLAYQDCGDFHIGLKVGEKLDFLTSGSVRGQFSVKEVPEGLGSAEKTLLLVARRYDTQSTAMAFSSHLFERSQGAQIAVIDAYKGPAKGLLQLLHNADEDTKSLVRFGTAITVSPGVYKAILVDPDNDQRISSPNRFAAAGNETYVLLRTGIQAEAGPNYKEDLFVYPRSSPFRLVGTSRGAAANSRALPPAFWLSFCSGGLLLLLANFGERAGG